MTIKEKIQQSLQKFQPVSLSEMDSVRLMVRKDKKYIFPVTKLPLILDSVKDTYRVLEIEGTRGQEYSTTYFDTPEMDLYLMHHRGKLNRQKIRLRTYNSDGASFLEVKRKSNLGFTNKSRVEVSQDPGLVLNEEEEFVSKLMPFGAGELKTVLQNEFNRITLVNFETQERVTLDFGIKIKKEGSENWINLNGISIAEVKRSGTFFRSEFAKVLKKNKIYPLRFSKYCYGVASTFRNVPKNRFKEKFMKVDQINKEYQDSYDSILTDLNSKSST